jgi:hypothetical protein
MRDELHPLPADVAALLVAERRAPGPPPLEIDRLLGTIQARIGAASASEAAPLGRGARPGVTTAQGATTIAAKPFLVALAVVSAVGGAVAVHWSRGRHAAGSRAVAVDGFVPAAAVPARAAPPGTSATAPATASDIAPDMRRSGAAATALPAGGDLAAESALLDVAFRALARNDAPAALRALAEHRRAFATGGLVEERDALEVKALARAGDLDDARRQARQFQHQFPHSVQLQSIMTVVGLPSAEKGGAR